MKIAGKAEEAGFTYSLLNLFPSRWIYVGDQLCLGGKLAMEPWVKKMYLVIFALVAAVGCGGDDDENEVAAATLTFAGDVAPILEKSCAQSGGCHESGNSLGLNAYVASESLLKENSATVVTRISLDSSSAGVMPTAASGLSLSATDKQSIIDFLAQ